MLLGSIVSCLASPTQDGMKHPEMHKKGESKNNFFGGEKKFGVKKKKFKKRENESCLKLLELPRNYVLGCGVGGGSCHEGIPDITE